MWARDGDVGELPSCVHGNQLYDIGGLFDTVKFLFGRLILGWEFDYNGDVAVGLYALVKTLAPVLRLKSFLLTP